MNSTIPHFLDYEDYLTLEKRLAPTTVGAYLSDLDKYFAEEESHSLAQIMGAEPERFNRYLQGLATAGTSPRTRNRKASSITGFFRYLEKEELIPRNPLQRARQTKIQKYKPDHLTLTEIQTIYNSIDLTAPAGPRNKCLLELLYGAGLRVSEAINLTLERVRFQDKLLHIQGKGNKHRLVPVGSEILRSIKMYVSGERLRLNQGSENLILNQRGNPMSRMGAWKIVAKIARNAGLTKNIHPHTFRHTYATHLIEAGADLRAVQELLGHSDITTTEIYTHLDENYLFEVHQSFHPRNKRTFL